MRAHVEGWWSTQSFREKEMEGSLAASYMPGPVKAAFTCVIPMSPIPTHAILRSIQAGDICLKNKIAGRKENKAGVVRLFVHSWRTRKKPGSQA